MALAQALGATPFIALSEGSSAFPVSSSWLVPISIRLNNGMLKSSCQLRRRSASLRSRFSGRAIRAMVHDNAKQQGTSSVDAKEMERLSAKKSLLSALKEAGGFEALVSGRTTEKQRADVAERMTSLERLNTTSQPTTSPYLEGNWVLDWFGGSSPGLSAAASIFERIISGMAHVSRPDVSIKDGHLKLTANVRLLIAIELKFLLTSKLSVEGQLMKEQLSEGFIQSPITIEESLLEHMNGLFGQATNIPTPVPDTASNGFKIPLSGTNISRKFSISYLDEEIVIIRDTNGMPEVLTRLD